MPVGKKIRVAVLFGGRSGEHEVSLASARSVMDAMDKERYEIVPVGITKSGQWLLESDPMARLTSGKEQPEPPGSEPAQDTLVATGGRELVPGATRTRFPDVDVVFPVLHGSFGEDGTVQGLLELADLAYVGSGVLGSAVGMDKIVQKKVLEASGIPVVDYVPVQRSAWRAQPADVVAQIEAQLVYPVFVKPANMGSSVGVSKAKDTAELRTALNLAARFDRRLIVEQGVDAREIECSVLGNDTPIASVPGEVVPCNEFYDYRAKYIDGDSALIIPADLEPAVAQQVRDLAVQAFLATDCAGLARVDFFLCRKTGQVWLNELNTIPGFTAISMYPKLWEASGLPYARLIDRLVDLALERHADRGTTETSYGFDH